MHGLSISIIVPIYNEMDVVGALLEHLAGLDASDIVIVDGGSTDGTWERLQEAEARSGAPPGATGGPGDGIRLFRTSAGRARQMNTGALHAAGDILLFLHADTRLPPGAMERIVTGLTGRPGCRWGRFDVRFDRAGPALHLVARAMNLRSAWSGICTGDQALFVYRGDFLRSGGFAPVALMEDVELSRRLKQRSRPLRIREPVITASRRWRRDGVAWTIVLMWRLRWLYWWGVPASALARRYYPNS